MTSEAVQSIYARLHQAQEAFERQVAGVSPDQFRKAPREGEWSPAEIVAHVCESTPFSAANALKMAREDTPFIGRDEAGARARRQAITDHAQDSLEVALENLKRANAEVLKMVSSLSDDQLPRTGRHPQRGVITVEQVLEGVISHIEEHTRQVAEAVQG